MKLITILTLENYSLTFNPEHLVSIVYNEKKTVIRLSDGSAYNVSYTVSEIIEEIQNTKSI